MKSSLKIGSALGIPIRLHITFLLILPLIAYTFAVGPTKSPYPFGPLGFSALGGNTLLQFGLGTLLLKYSRDQEYEADRLGIKQMFLSKQYDPQGLINFFNNLLKLEGNPPSQFEQMFLTHPTTHDRIVAAQNYLNGLKNGTIKP
jgi:Zn-dependent protease with chaperone function